MLISHYKNFSTAQFGTVGSTQTLAKQSINGENFELNKMLIELLKENKFLVLTAESQSSGIGQHDRKWDSPVGNVYMSCVVKLQQCNMINLTQVFTALIHDVLSEYGIKTQIKWINDILHNEKKLSGVLCEVTKFKNEDVLIVGMGVNVNVAGENRECISNLLNRDIDVLEIILKICNKIPMYLNDFFQHGIKFFLDTLNQNAAYYNQSIILKQKLYTIEGVFKGYDNNGMLIIDSVNRKHVLYEGRMSLKE